MIKSLKEMTGPGPDISRAWVVRIAGVALLALLLMALAACADDPTATPAPTATPEPEPQPMTIVDIAVSDGRFGTLVAALQAAELVETLSGPGPFTVFAPTDDAFAKLPEGTVESLLADIPALTDVLLYHVVSGDVKAADVVNLEAAATVQGAEVAITVEGNTVMVNDAQVIITDIEASNGVIHVVDTVLLPPTTTGSIVVPPTAGERVQAGRIAGIESGGVRSALKVL